MRRVDIGLLGCKHSCWGDLWCRIKSCIICNLVSTCCALSDSRVGTSLFECCQKIPFVKQKRLHSRMVSRCIRLVLLCKFHYKVAQKSVTGCQFDSCVVTGSLGFANLKCQVVEICNVWLVSSLWHVKSAKSRLLFLESSNCLVDKSNILETKPCGF